MKQKLKLNHSKTKGSSIGNSAKFHKDNNLLDQLAAIDGWLRGLRYELDFAQYQANNREAFKRSKPSLMFYTRSGQGKVGNVKKFRAGRSPAERVDMLDQWLNKLIDERKHVEDAIRERTPSMEHSTWSK